MRSKFLLIFTITTVLGSLFIMLAACSVSSGVPDQIDAPTDDQVGLVERDDDQINTGTPVPETLEPLSLQPKPPQDGHLLLKRYCAACHVVQWIEQFDESRSYWEKILVQMAGLGVKIDESHRDPLLDYLASDNES